MFLLPLIFDKEVIIHTGGKTAPVTICAYKVMLEPIVKVWFTSTVTELIFAEHILL